MKVLMYGNRKEDCSYWDISTPEKEEAGFRCLFRHLDENWQMFQYAVEELELVQKAKAGDYKSIRRILRSIQGGECAEWSIIEVMNPLEG